MDRYQPALECLEIEKAGCSVREFLKSCGCISPWGTWYRLQREELGRDRYHIKDGKGEMIMANITAQQREAAIQIAIRGEDPVAFLKECGSKRPEVAWANIRRVLRKGDPERFDSVMAEEFQPAEKAEEEWTKYEPEEQVNLTIKSGDLKIKSEPAITAPVNYGGFDVSAIRDPELGEFYHDRKFRCMDWRLEDGDEVSLSIGGWHRLIEKLPEIMKILGI